ncbi:MAG: acyl-CoA dehydrogenase family protein [bacterium]
MTYKYELGKKHIACKNNANTDIVESNGSIIDMMSRGYGVIPSAEAKYEDYLGLTVVTEEIAKINPEVAAVLADLAVAREILTRYGNAQGKELASANEVIAVICSEPGITSLNSVSATLVKSENGYTLNGKKLVSSEQMNSDKFIVLAKDENEKIQLVCLTKEQFNIVGVTKKVAGKNVLLNQAVVETSITEAQLVGSINDDFEAVLSIARTLIAAVAIGIGHSAIVSSIQTAKEVKGAENRLALSNTQSLQFTLADMFTEVEAGRMLAYFSADTIDKAKPNVKYATMAKIQASDAAAAVSVQALQILGNLGYLGNNEFADVIMSAVNCQVKGGTNRVQKNQLYKYLLAKK